MKTQTYPTICLLTAVICLAMALAPMARAEQGYITDGNAYFEFEGTLGNPGRIVFSDDGGTTNHGWQHWWWYHLEGDAQARKFPSNASDPTYYGPDSESYVGNTATLNWTDSIEVNYYYNLPDPPSLFDAELKLVIKEVAPGQVRLIEKMTITNTKASPLTIKLFNYLDEQLGGTMYNDSAELIDSNPPRMQITDDTSGDYMQFLGVYANAWQASSTTFEILNKLQNSTDTDLTNEDLPIISGPGSDFNGAFQWNLVIPPGESVTVTVGLTINAEVYTCFGLDLADPNVCGGHGDCIATDECSCESGWMGSQCGQKLIYVDHLATGLDDGTSWDDAYPDFHTALSMAQPGDTIWVAEGIYKPLDDYGLDIGPRGFHFRMKNNVQIFGGFDGWEDPNDFDLNDRNFELNETILSGDSDFGVLGDPNDNCYHVFYHPDGLGLDPNAILDGFTITGGNADSDYPHFFGGGMYNYSNSPTVTNCIFSSNAAKRDGGGMYNVNSSPTIANCTFSGNYSYSNFGGGGMFNENGSPTVTNCTFSGNTTAFYGGGMFNYGSSPIVTNCAFSGNTAGDSGGGMYNHIESDSTITNCTFSGNTAGSDAGGMGNSFLSNPTVTNCAFSGNTAGESGGGMYNEDSSPTIMNCILWGNTASTTGDEIFGGPPSVTYSVVQDGTGLSWFDSDPNNIDENPLFVDPNGLDGEIGTPDDNLRLKRGSPCIDAGNPNYIAEPGETDLDGNPRKQDGNGDGTATVDMGAYEYTPPESGIYIYVDDTAGGDDDGSSWDDAFIELQDALDYALPGDTIWVAAGTYYPTDDYGLTVGDPNRLVHFRMKRDVEIYGGFEGFEDPNDFDLADRNFTDNETILSGDLLGNDNPDTPVENLLLDPTRADNCYHVFYHPTGLDLDPNAIFDGFTITGGNADFAFGNAFEHRKQGAGMLNWTGNHPTISNCVFSQNSAYAYGGGMENYHSDPIITNCTFSGNTGAGVGGGMYNETSGPRITNSSFSGNTADDGGGMCNLVSDPTVTNCTFSGNTADDTGGGMFNHYSSPTMTNCTFTGNLANISGGMFNHYSSPTITNCIFRGDSAISFDNEIGNDASDPNFSYCNIAGSNGSGGSWDTNLGTDGGGNIDADPLFVDPNGLDGEIGTPDDDLRLLHGSPCIDAGNNDAVPDGIETDLNGNDRIQDGDGIGPVIVDMGACEKAPPTDIIFVDHNANGKNDGTSWTDAYTSLQYARDDATVGVDVWVAAGTYKPTSVYDLDGGDRYKHFRMKNNVGIYGGFEGIEDPNTFDLNDRNFELNETILSGDLLGDDNPGTPVEDLLLDPTRADNCYHVFYHPEELDPDPNAILDGFTITGGNADGYGQPHGTGGGMYNYGNSPTVTNCTFSSNSADYSGGGMYNYLYSSPTVNNCTFSKNAAGSEGGGIDNWKYCNPIITNCTFNGNLANYYGGGIDNWEYCNPIITNCTFSTNSANSNGGGIHNWEYSNSLTTNCTFSGNIADDGGGMFNGLHSNSTVINCIFWGNMAAIGNEIYNDSSSPIVTYCDIEGSYTGLGNIDVDPNFVDAAGGDFHLQSAGWRWNGIEWIIDGVTSRCIDAGSPGYPLGAEEDPLDEYTINLRINMGAYGGTAEASMAPLGWAILSDVNNDGICNLPDFAELAARWLNSGEKQPTDFYRDEVIDIQDVVLFAEDFLKQTTWH